MQSAIIGDVAIVVGGGDGERGRRTIKTQIIKEGVGVGMGPVIRPADVV